MLLSTLYKLVLIVTGEFVDWIVNCDHYNKSYWKEFSCGAVYYAVQGGSNFSSVDKILKCDHSNESYWAVLSCGTVYHAVQTGSGCKYMVCL